MLSLMAGFEKMFVDQIIGILQKAQAQQQIDLFALEIEASDAANILLLGMDGIKTSSLSLQMLEEQTKLFLTIFWKGLQ